MISAEPSRPFFRRLPALTLDHPFLKRYIGYHLIELFGDLFPEMSNDEVERLICDYRTIYPARGHKLTTVYPGVRETLAALPGRKSTATTKGTPTTRLILEQFGLLPYFDHVQGTDGFPCKPNPDVILKSLAVFQGESGRLPDDRGFRSGHGCRAARGCEDVRRPLWLRR